MPITHPGVVVYELPGIVDCMVTESPLQYRGVDNYAGERACPKRMIFGPCGGVRDDGSCEVDARPCPFATMPEALPWPERTQRPSDHSELIAASRMRPVILTDLTVAPFDRQNIEQVTAIVSDVSDALLVGEHHNRPDFPPTMMAQLIRDGGGRPWITLTCRDRNQIVLEQEMRGLIAAGADGVFCVTGDSRAPGVRSDVTQVFDLDGTRLTALAAHAGLAVGVPEAPQAPPVAIRPARLLQKQRAGAQMAVLNHVATTELVEFIRTARQEGVTIPIIAGVAVYSDERSANVLAGFPGLQLSREQINRVLTADDPVEAGIETAVTEALEILAIDGIDGVNLSGLAAGTGELDGARVKAEIARRIRDRMPTSVQGGRR